jgi:hypothetical protein
MHPFTINSTLAHTNPRNEVCWFSCLFFKSIDFAKLASATTNGLKKIKFYCAHFFIPMVFFNSKNIIGTSYVSCTQRGRRGGWERVLGTINLSPSWA